MYNAPYQGVANSLAQYGRYGDSMLVHMNPIEVQMLSRLSPTGQLTTNPMTGQKEAFLPFLAPLLGSFLGSSLLTGAGAGILGTGLSSAAAGAIGSGLATAAVTGDLEQGILSGITGFGLGQAFGAAGDALSKAGADTATQAATQGVTEGVTGAANIAPQNLGTMANAPMESFLPQELPIDQLNLNVPNVSAAQQALLETPLSAGMQAAPQAMSRLSSMPMEQFSKLSPPPLSATERLAAPFKQPGAFFSQLTEPGSFLPMYVGETGRMAREQELMGRGSAAAFEEQDEKERARIRGQMGDVFNRIRTAYPGVGYAEGGMVENYFDGGNIEETVRQYLNQSQLGIPAAQDVQLSLRGSEFVPPPASSYSALDVGGQGYLAGVAPEFQYFREPVGVAPPTGFNPPPPGTVAGSGQNLQNFLSGLGGYSGFLNLMNMYAGSGAGTGTAGGTTGGGTTGGGTTGGGTIGGGTTGGGVTGGGGAPPTFNYQQSLDDETRNIMGMNPGMSYDEARNFILTSGRYPQFSGSGAGISGGTGTGGSVTGGGGTAGTGTTAGSFDINAFQNLLNQQFNPLQERLAGLESRLGQQTTQPTIDFTPIQERLAGLESRLGQAPSVDLSGIEQRLAGLESRGTPEFDYSRIPSYTPPDLSGIEQRLASFEGRLSSLPAQQPVGPAPIDLSGFESRFGELESRLNEINRPAYTPFDMGDLQNRLAGLESRVGNINIPSYTPPDLSGLESRLGGLESRFGNIQFPQVDLSGLESRLGGLESRVGGINIPTYTPPDLSGLESRLGGLESRFANFQLPQVNFPQVDLSPLQQQIMDLRSGLGALQSREIPTVDLSGIEQRLASVEGRPMPQVNIDPVMERLAALENLYAQPRASFNQNEYAGLEDFYGFAEGGMTPSEGMESDVEQPDLVRMTVAAIRGEVENADQIIRAFVEQYGSEMFMELRNRVLQDIVPDAQTEGMIEGNGGGQDDLVEGMIGSQRPVAVSPGEYIIPADVVSLAGGGYSGDGAKFFDGLIDDIRQKTMGTTEQVRPYQRSA